ncbi:uncharacterized protein LACBIDRAFT_303978 [Laccaria bicolor S238N-H82]|uniref:Predicted protein n=1 Tax=Laccaria bicolor (strain S238N-H82 / ATCC MYA-4686) TaxID=486041 RepID=B0DKP1_LACBS|nr:uncharacterized protein LACBIDRAFT_303978 [Laccaria bicolor S238N-H82]EDR04679.1 predicted protein [Laccaria bicolor S238N-H82]|eukprot:XP_001884503.1 predicted protein [Laccaria bicolor S238N-H82]
MLESIFKGIYVFVGLWAFYRVLRRLVVKTALDNIPGPPSPSFFKGNFPQLFNVDGWDFHHDIATKYGGVVKATRRQHSLCLIKENQLYVFDPKAMHHIVVKVSQTSHSTFFCAKIHVCFKQDQHSYGKESSIFVFNRLLFGNGLLANKGERCERFSGYTNSFSDVGERHRRQRKMLNPVFSIAHMREMVPIFYNVTHNLRASIALKVEDGPQEIDLVSWMARTALELIGQSGLGYSFDSLAEDAAPHPYSDSVKKLVPTIIRVAFFRAYLLVPALKIGTPKFRRFVLDLLPWKNLHDVRDIVDVMYNTSVEIFESKKKALMDGDEALAAQIGRGKDIMSILMRANLQATDEDRLDESELIGQMSCVSTFTKNPAACSGSNFLFPRTLIFAAMDTTSNALARTLFLLAQNQDVQEKLRREVTEARVKYGDLAYDELVALPYLDAVCRETLRLYPPLSYLLRTTCADTVMPLSNPIKGLDGREINEIPLPKNTNIIISALASNRDPEIWGSDSLEWIPERWVSASPFSVASAPIPGVYSNLMTFGGGGRACIGFKFSQLEMKVVLSVLIESFKFSHSDKEIFWQMNSIATPIVIGGNGKNELPLRVSKV